MYIFLGNPGNGLGILNYPRDVSLRENRGIFYVCDTWNHRIMEYQTPSVIGTVVAGGNGAGSTSNKLNYPYAVHFDNNSLSLLILNNVGQNLVRWTLNASTWTLFAGSDGDVLQLQSVSFNAPSGMTVDFMGNVYVADTQNQRIQFYYANGTGGFTIAGVGVAGNEAAYLESPYGVALDNRMNLYVADTFNCRIQRFRFGSYAALNGYGLQ